jgi:UDP-2-acetamido-3-amino-2,3-dideoxy-glucuronate N-acetyltransferase
LEGDGVSHPLRVAVVGVGRWGYNLAKTLAELEGCEVVTLCDSNLQQAQQIAAELGVPNTTDHFENVLESAVEAVVIATPPENHARLAMLSVQAGKHVFVEKPLATSLAEGLELERVATSSRKLVMAGHLLRFHGGVACLRRLISSGELGAIDFSLSRRLGWRAADRCGPWWSLAPHDLSVLRGCLGVEPQRIAAAAALEPPVSWNPVRALLSSGVVGQRPAVRSPIRVTALCEFVGGVRSLVDVGLLDQSKMRRVIVVGRRAMARFDDGDQGGVWIKNTPRNITWPDMPVEAHPFTVEEADRLVDMVEDLCNRGDPWVLVESDWPRPLALEMRQFVAGCENQKLARIEMEDALAILRALEAGARSMRDDSRSVRVLPKSKGGDNGHDVPTSAPDW